MRVLSIGKTVEGREIPLVIFSDPPVSDPRAAAKLHKPVVLVQANIHAGEVEGKEALMMLSRRITHGDLRPLLKDLVILFIPDYNADGNEKIALENRTAHEYGPIVTVWACGKMTIWAWTSIAITMKLEAPESEQRPGPPLYAMGPADDRGFAHHADGSYHGYHLTYSVPLESQ